MGSGTLAPTPTIPTASSRRPSRTVPTGRVPWTYADRLEDGLGVALDSGHEDVVAEVGLIGVDADGPDAPDRGRGERAEAAAACCGEDDVGSDVDLSIGTCLAR